MVFQCNMFSARSRFSPVNFLSIKFFIFCNQLSLFCFGSCLFGSYLTFQLALGSGGSLYLYIQCLCNLILFCGCSFNFCVKCLNSCVISKFTVNCIHFLFRCERLNGSSNLSSDISTLCQWLKFRFISL